MKKLFSTTFILLSLLAASVVNSSAQTSGGTDFKFDTGLSKTLKAEQEDLKKLMKETQIEMRQVMKEIAKMMKEEQKKSKKEMEKLKVETKLLQKEILEALKESQKISRTDNKILKAEFKQFKSEAKNLALEMGAALESGKQEREQETEEMKAALEEVKLAAEQAKIEADELIEENRATAEIEQEERKLVMESSRAEILSDLALTIETLESESEQFQLESAKSKEETILAMNIVQGELKESLGEFQDESKQFQLELAKSKEETVLAMNIVQGELKESLGHFQKEAAQVIDETPATRDLAQDLSEEFKQYQPPAKTSKRKRLKKSRPTRKIPKAVIKRARPKQVQPKKGPAFKTRLAKLELPEPFILGEPTIIEPLAQTAEEPIKKIHKQKLTHFSEDIEGLKMEIAKGGKNAEHLMIAIGKAYLDSQRYLNSMNSEERLKLIHYADTSKTILGTHQIAIWAFKTALRSNPDNGKTHLIISEIYDEMQEGDDAILHAKIGAHLFSKNGQTQKAAQATSFTKALYDKYGLAPDHIAFGGTR